MLINNTSKKQKFQLFDNSNSHFGEVEVEAKVKEKKKLREINCSHKKILEGLMFFLNLNLNLNLAILKMRIADLII
jgi:hypothetical protein